MSLSPIELALKDLLTTLYPECQVDVRPAGRTLRLIKPCAVLIGVEEASLRILTLGYGSLVEEVRVNITLYRKSIPDVAQAIKDIDSMELALVNKLRELKGIGGYYIAQVNQTSRTESLRHPGLIISSISLSLEKVIGAECKVSC